MKKSISLHSDYADPGTDKSIDTDFESEKPFISERANTVSSVNLKDNDDNIIVETETQPALPPSTHKNDPTEDLCRGDDKVRCGKTNVFICDIQRCDGQPDCPNGEDEDPASCPENVRGCSLRFCLVFRFLRYNWNVYLTFCRLILPPFAFDIKLLSSDHGSRQGEMYLISKLRSHKFASIEQLP